jgi:hypothetical protein
MDGVMFMHNPIINRLRNSLGDPFAGIVCRMNSSFSFHGESSFFENNIRCKSDGDKLGSLGDLGWYNIRLAIITFLQGQDIKLLSSTSAIEYNSLILPRYVRATSHHKTPDGVPLDCDGEIIFGNDNVIKISFILF